MKWSFTTVGLIVLGLIGVSIILLFQNLTTNNENDYYLLKEITEASMFDAIDYKTYRETGELRIKEKVFVESFTRRFAESTLFVGSTYKIFMYDIMEYPPKVTIAIDTGIGKFTIYNDTSDYSVVNSLSAILEYNNFDFSNIVEDSIFYTGSSSSYSSSNGKYVQKEFVKDYYSFVGIGKNTNIEFRQVLSVPDILSVSGGLINIIDAEVIDGPNIVTDDFTENVMIAILNRDVDWVADYKTDYFNVDYSNDDSYYYGNFNISKINDIKLCDSNIDTKCNGINTFLFSWRGSVDKTDKSILFVKYKIKWNYEIFVG